MKSDLALDLFDNTVRAEGFGMARDSENERAALVEDSPEGAPVSSLPVRDGGDLSLEPLDATFRDSGKAPLHSWFPYLEGYSPNFVERVRREYLQGAARIIEPFAGSGTTPIVMGQAGIECAFSEANPAMAFISETKLAVLKLSERARKRLAESLASLANELPDRVGSTEGDASLHAAYRATFGTSVFFDDSSMEAVLRLRALNDELLTRDPLLADCFAVAVLSSLIPSSRLKRAGDLRYKTEKELSSGLPGPAELTAVRLDSQARDLVGCTPLTANAYLACATADQLHHHLDDGWDGVITSPPYLNGTNYIRNARLELWYLRHLRNKADIRHLRNRVVTAGINDVHAQTDWKPITPGIERVMLAIQENAYDTRIAKMVGGYFRDMAGVLYSLGACVRPTGRLCVDIGDSVYNQVHVPTDDLLVELAELIGYTTVERVHLRKRTSKGGQPVRQQLLVFERPRKLRMLGASHK